MPRVEIPAPGDLIMDEDGNVQANVTVSLTLAGTLTDTTHYSALTGGTSTTGGLKSGSDGTVVDGSGNTRYVDSGLPLDMTIAGKTKQIEPHAASGDVGLMVAAATGVAATDNANIQAKLTAAGASGATAVTLREGSYSFTNLTFPVLGAGTLKLVGQGIGKTILTCTGASGAAITFGDGGGTDAQRTICQDFTLNGNANMDAGVRLNNTRFAALERVKIDGFTKAGAKSVDIIGGVAEYFARFTHCQFRNSPIGIYMDGGGASIGANSNYVEYCHFGVHSSYAIQIAQGDSNVIFANEFNGSIATGVRMDGDANNNKVCFNQFDGSTLDVDINASTCDRTQLIGNTNLLTWTDNGTDTLRIDAQVLKIPSTADWQIALGLDMGGYTLSPPTNGLGVGGDVRSNNPISAEHGEAAEVRIGAVGPASEAAVQYNRANTGGITGARHYLRGTGSLTVEAADWEVGTVGKGLRVKEGSNAKQGVSGAMTAGSVTVANTAITANSRLQLTRQAGGTNPGAVYESTRTAGTSFVITSTNAGDTGTVAYEIFEPA